MIEQLAKIPVEVDYGSEFRYRDPIIDPHTLVRGHQPVRRNGRHSRRAARSQAKRREDSGNLQRGRARCSRAKPTARSYTHAGPEIGVASTKAFTGQLTALAILALYLGQVRGKLPPMPPSN